MTRFRLAGQRTFHSLRVRNYRAILGLIYRSSDRWPKLRALVKTHRAIFLRWPTVVPSLLTLLLALANASASHFAWSYARVTVGDLWSHPAALRPPRPPAARPP